MQPDHASRTVLAVCGLAVEARLAAGPGVRTLAGGARSRALANAIERELAAGAAAIISFGVAGALTSDLAPGALIVASTIVGDAENFPVDAEWASALLRRLPTAIHAPLAGRDSVVADPESKSRLHIETGASAVDMESHVAACIAAEHGLPFVALRAIADPLARALPQAALIAMRFDGGVDLRAVMQSVARRPHQLPQLLRIALDMRRALSALARGRRLLGDRLGYADLDELLLHVI
ncbi:MAG: phosphorylase [Burkholderiaceae bacterium]